VQSRTPLIIGFEDVVFGQDPTETGTAAYAVVQNGGYESVGAYVAQIGVWAAVIHAIVGIAIPFIGVAMMTRFFGEERSLKPAIEVIPLTLFAWASFVIPYLLTAYFLGPTFPGLLGAMVGLLVVGSTLRAGYFLPEEEWDFGPQEQWPDHWIGKIEPGTGMGTSDTGQKVAADGGTSRFEEMHSQDMSLGMGVGSLHPRCGPTDRDSSHRTRAGFLSSTGVITWNNILGTPFSEGIEIFYLPGSLFVLVAVVTYGLHGMDSGDQRLVGRSHHEHHSGGHRAVVRRGDGDGHAKDRCRHRDQQRRSRRSGHAAVAVPIHGEPHWPAVPVLLALHRRVRRVHRRFEHGQRHPVRPLSVQRRPSRSAPRPKLWSPHRRSVAQSVTSSLSTRRRRAHCCRPHR